MDAKSITKRDNIEKEQCALQQFGEGVGRIDLYDNSELYTEWAYAGVNPNANYLCVANVSTESRFHPQILYKALLANAATSNNSQFGNGCEFDVAACPDPLLRQQIIDLNFCRSPFRPQEFVDRLMLSLNRPGWIYVTLSADYGLGWVPGTSVGDDNYCRMFMVSTNWWLLAAKVDVS